jgi:predicted nucleic acid-binding protein
VEESEFTPLIVCDAGPLIHLDELKCIDLLAGFSEVLVPEVVWQEVRRHRPSALRRRMVTLTRVAVPGGPNADLKRISELFTLDPGEEQALNLMGVRPGATLLTDDRAARSAAQAMAYPVHGTIGVLVIGWRRGQRSQRQLLNLIRTLPKRSTLHVSKAILDGVISQVQAGDA